MPSDGVNEFSQLAIYFPHISKEQQKPVCKTFCL